MKEITLKEWSAYLPYGLICEVKDQEEIKTDTLSGIYDNKELVFHNIVESYQGFESIKPILYDLSWLTREITHEGETFVPIHRLLENSNFDLSKMDDDYINSFAESMIEIAPTYDDVQTLLSWHFNFFQIPDELIVRVTEDFNPYK